MSLRDYEDDEDAMSDYYENKTNDRYCDECQCTGYHRANCPNDDGDDEDE